MRYTTGFLAVWLLAGCAGSPPKPPTVQGEYRPVNRVATPVTVNSKAIAPEVFDFNFEGDIVAALDALRAVQPQLIVLPSQGKAFPLAIRVSLRNTTIEGALRAIGQEGRGMADVVLNTTKSKNTNQVFIQFKKSTPQPGAANATPSAAPN